MRTRRTAHHHTLTANYKRGIQTFRARPASTSARATNHIEARW